MVILITGITSGFGQAMARKLAEDGHKVYGTHRKDVERIPDVSYIKADVCSEEDCRNAVQQVLDAEGHIDVFINNAGMGIGGPLEFSSLEDARVQMDTNWMGMVRFLHFVIPAMRSQGYGKILAFSSIAGKMGLPFQGLYSASKYAIEGYCEALRLELRSSGITVTVVEPGDFSTGFTASRKKVENPEAAAAYPSYFKSMAGMENDEKTGLKPEYLADRISGIVRKKNPAYSYVIASPVQKLSIPLKTLLPKKLWAKIFASWYGL